ncbi:MULTISPECIES: hypothetical protein [Delftia]|uniref:hypothetical protein n=1 Tax=Delftia TaxID=80865 RepID=UPI001FCBB0A2|nr:MULTISPECIES: hypothetical protein [Delftia]BDE74078.1 hypothetical protein HQS1_52020 [Delftia lacustris]
MAKASTTSIPSDADWRADEDMRTLARAEEIRKDPKRLKAALAKAKEKIAELQNLQTPGKK